MTFRHFMSWKPLFYDGLLPVLKILGPSRGDDVLGAFGRLLAAWPPRRRELFRALTRLRRETNANWDIPKTQSRLEGNILRYLARDCRLDGGTDAEFFARFDVSGFEHLEEAIGRGRGVILVGSHLGAHLSANHWIFRRGLPMKMLIQRPVRVSRYQSAKYDLAEDSNPQAGFFLKRNLPSEEATKRIFRTRRALREGEIVYLMGDVPWSGGNTQSVRFLGYRRTFQSLWAEFAARFRSPVVTVTCTHLPGGRYALTFEPGGIVERGEEGAAVARFLSRLENKIVAHPDDAAAYLLWSCYGSPADGDGKSRRRPTTLPSQVSQSL